MEKKPNEPILDLNDQVQARLDKLNRIIERGEVAYKNGFSPNALASDLHRLYDEKNHDELEAAAVKASVAGRIMAIRDFGKAAFVRVKDRSGLIQLFVQKAKLGDEGFEQAKSLDLGDVIYAEGQLFKTKTNELSVNCNTVSLLSKSLRPLPEKFHGISDIEIKYRQRYLDLIMSDESREIFRKRSKIIEEIRAFFLERD